MRVGVYDPYLDDCGGGEKYMMTIASYLSKTNTVDVFWNNKSDFERVFSRFDLDSSKINLKNNIFSTNVSIIKRFLISRKYDIFIFLSDGSLPFLFCKKLFVHIQRPIHINGGVFSLLYQLKKAKVNKFFCNSKFTKSFIDKQFKINSTVIYPPVSIFPKSVKKENIILHVGRFRVIDPTNGTKDYKKQYVMIATFKKMIDKGLNQWKFILAVSVDDKDIEAFEKLKQEAKGYPIFFEVNKSNKDLWFFYSKAKIYWHASGYGEDLNKFPESAEHFGISTAEAMGAGAVPVVINAGGQKEIVEDGVNGLLWDDLNELIEKTLLLINSQKLLLKLSKNARKRVQDFTLEKFQKKINDLIA